jgi:glycerol dehydrogenase
MKKVMIAPGRYVQGPGILADIGEQVKIFGDNALVAGGKTALSNTSAIIRNSLDSHQVKATFETFNGEACQSEIARLQQIAVENKANVIIGVGGGKCIDASKAVAYNLNVPIIIVPTIAATDAPCSALSVIYTEGGVVESYLILRQNPNVVFVDTEIIAKGPARFLVSGMGDALATRFEAEACLASSSMNIPGGYTTSAAIAIARLCYDSLIEYGYLAKLSCEQNVASPALEKIVEANTLHSGLGFESSGLAAAHAIHDGFTVLDETHHMWHGEKVAFGTLTQLVMENKPTALLDEVLYFCKSVGLPITLREINITDKSPENIMKVAQVAANDPAGLMKNMPFPVDAQFVYNCIMTADALGTAYHANSFGDMNIEHAWHGEKVS